VVVDVVRVIVRGDTEVEDGAAITVTEEGVEGITRTARTRLMT
jgi:hypothetical protein